MSRLPKTEHLVEHQARWRQIKEAAGLEEETPSLEVEGPYLTISRQLGSGGTELAQRVAGPLGWRVVDRELVAAIAEKTRASLGAVLAHDERASGLLDDYLSHLLVPDDPGHAAYLRAMTLIVASFAREGRVVILGRGANWFLDPERGLRVRVVRPFGQRVDQLARDEGLAIRDAEDRLRRHDEEQRRFIEQAFGRSIDDPLGYDLVINTGHLDLDQAAEIVTTALCRKLRRSGVGIPAS
ncbi:MAG: cytidylate kinase-like family protein [Acidobacteria bacterium]|nr:MAG: cytidylate kinase-like family protein [Acidobacteriota bacterium]